MHEDQRLTEQGLLKVVRGRGIILSNGLANKSLGRKRFQKKGRGIPWSYEEYEYNHSEWHIYRKLSKINNSHAL